MQLLRFWLSFSLPLIFNQSCREASQPEGERMLHPTSPLWASGEKGNRRRLHTTPAAWYKGWPGCWGKERKKNIPSPRSPAGSPGLPAATKITALPHSLSPGSDMVTTAPKRFGPMDQGTTLWQGLRLPCHGAQLLFSSRQTFPFPHHTRISPAVTSPANVIRATYFLTSSK